MDSPCLRAFKYRSYREPRMRAVSLALLFNLTHGAQTHMLRAQAFRIVIDRIRRVRRHFVELSAEFEFAPAIIGMRYEREYRRRSGNLVNIGLEPLPCCIARVPQAR